MSLDSNRTTRTAIQKLTRGGDGRGQYYVHSKDFCDFL